MESPAAATPSQSPSPGPAGSDGCCKGHKWPLPASATPVSINIGSKHLPFIPSLGLGGHPGLGEGKHRSLPSLPHQSPSLASAPRCTLLLGLAERGISHLRLAAAPREPVCQQPCHGALQPVRTPAGDPRAPAALRIPLTLPECVPSSVLPPTQPPRKGPRGSVSQHRPLPAPTALAT